jgi:general secretion pathway protein K
MAGRATASERGAALLVVLVAVAVVTVLAVDLAYDTRVSLRIAGNARDELQATYLAKSGVALSRLVLSFQQDLDAAFPGAIPGGLAPPRPQIWRLVPVGSTLAANLFGERPPPPPSAASAGPERAPEGAAAGPPSGGFEATIDDEGRKVNVQLDALGISNAGLLAAQVQAFWQLVCDPRWDAIFDREDENGQRYSRQDVIVYLKDWVDPDEVGSALAASFPTTCVMITAGNPFEQGFTDENFPYQRGEDRYRAKNARMDSLAELYMVAGVTDAFMAAFGDDLTVYLPRDAKRNVNTTDRARLLDLARIVADPPGQPVLYDAEFPDRLQKVVMERTFGGIFSLTPQDFGQIVGALGVKVNPNTFSETNPQNPFTDRSTVFQIRVAGRSGDVTKVLEAVVKFDKVQSGQAAVTAALQAANATQAAKAAGQKAATPGQPAATPGQAQAFPTQSVTPGQLVHWRED